MTPEAKARQNIDALLAAECWHFSKSANEPQIRIGTEVDHLTPIIRVFKTVVESKVKMA